MLAIFLIVVVDLIGFGIIIPLLPFYGEHFQADPQTVGLLMATYSLAQFISAPLWGRLSDHAGRRPVLLLSLAGAAAAYVWLAFADALWMLFMARALGGLMAGNISAAFAYMADITTKENRAKGMGLIGAAFGIGFILGPAIGGILAGPDPLTADYRSPALAAAGLSLFALLLGIVRLPESLSVEVRARAAAM
ncbi:MAG: MFS transporter, partial [Alphaproteobacteria bacterium]